MLNMDTCYVLFGEYFKIKLPLKKLQIKNQTNKQTAEIIWSVLCTATPSKQYKCGFLCLRSQKVFLEKKKPQKNEQTKR